MSDFLEFEFRNVRVKFVHNFEYEMVEFCGECLCSEFKVNLSSRFDENRFVECIFLSD